ncbi:MAG TPA: hypothetical protein VLL75_04905 [Vicinamibacteria bacterium]|nr:hypothetical protein [Vicinamibacteria bacterium]
MINGLNGIPATEEQALRSRGEDYREYQRTTAPSEEAGCPDPGPPDSLRRPGAQ